MTDFESWKLISSQLEQGDAAKWEKILRKTFEQGGIGFLATDIFSISRMPTSDLLLITPDFPDFLPVKSSLECLIVAIREGVFPPKEL